MCCADILYGKQSTAIKAEEICGLSVDELARLEIEEFYYAALFDLFIFVGL